MYEGTDAKTGLCKGYIDEKAQKSVDLDEFTKYRISSSLKANDYPRYEWEIQIANNTGIDYEKVAIIYYCENLIHEALRSDYDPCPYRTGELIAELSGAKLEDVFKVLQAEFVMEYESAEEDELEDMMCDELYDQMVEEELRAIKEKERKRMSAL